MKDSIFLLKVELLNINVEFEILKCCFCMLSFSVASNNFEINILEASVVNFKLFLVLQITVYFICIKKILITILR